MRNVLFYLNNRIILFFIALLFFATLTHATIPRLQNKQLDYELTPYLWATGQTGTIQWLRGPGNGIAINQSFSDILKRLDRAGMVYFEVKNEQGGLLIDGIYSITHKQRDKLFVKIKGFNRKKSKMPYSVDLRERAVQAVHQGMKKIKV